MFVLMSALPEKISVGSAIAYSLLGFAIVFAALIVLWGIINIMVSIFKKFKNRSETPANTPVVSAPTSAPVSPSAGSLAPGSAGDLMIHDVSEKTAAILMAIVANKIGRPLNELRFISIKEVK